MIGYPIGVAARWEIVRDLAARLVAAEEQIRDLRDDVARLKAQVAWKLGERGER